MTKNYMFAGGLLLIGTCLAWQKDTIGSKQEKFAHNKLYASGAPAGRTGAPGEANCTSCHFGTVQSGNSENLVMISQNADVVTGYNVGETYQVTVTTASMVPKRGFQMTVLDGSNQMAGNFTSINGGVSIISGAAGKKYANQTGAGTNTSNFPAWTFEWTAPATDVGPVTFYVATNKTNSNGNDSGDQIFTSQHPIGSTASAEELKKSVKDFTAGFSAGNSMLYLQYSSAIVGESTVNIVDLSGKSILTTQLLATQIGLNKQSIRIPDYVRPGMYFVHFFVDNHPMSQSFLVER